MSPVPAERERVALYDPKDPVGSIAGQAERWQVRAENLPHAATAVIVRDGAGRILAHRRSPDKDLWPSRIDVAAGGVINAGESPELAVRRELAEELGIENVNPTELATIWYRDRDTHYLSHLYELRWDGPIRFADGEVTEAWWVDPERLGTILDDPAMVPDTQWILRRLDGIRPDAAPWRPGDVALVRFGRSGRSVAVRTARVVRDDETGMLLWIPAATAVVDQVLSTGEEIRSLPVDQRGTAPRMRVARRWRGAGAYHFYPAQHAGWSLWTFYTPDGDVRGWYGNLESPPQRRRTLDGSRLLDMQDHALDVWIPLDGGRAVPRWKDADEFAAFTGLPGRWGQSGTQAIQAAGQDVWERALRRVAPFDSDPLRPPGANDPVGVACELPQDWDLPHAAT